MSSSIDTLLRWHPQFCTFCNGSAEMLSPAAEKQTAAMGRFCQARRFCSVAKPQ